MIVGFSLNTCWSYWKLHGSGNTPAKYAHECPFRWGRKERIRDGMEKRKKTAPVTKWRVLWQLSTVLRVCSPSVGTEVTHNYDTRNKSCSNNPQNRVRGRPGLNQGPLDLQSNALPLSYTPGCAPYRCMRQSCSQSYSVITFVFVEFKVYWLYMGH